jgi:hypothetical protein
MIYGPGGYRFSDYLRFGGPLNLLVMALTVTLAPLLWPFSDTSVAEAIPRPRVTRLVHRPAPAAHRPAAIPATTSANRSISAAVL